MRTYSTLKELEENSSELPEGIANHPMLTPMSKLVKEAPVTPKKIHDAGHRDEKLLKKHDEEGGKSSVEKDAYPQDTSVPPEAKDLKSVNLKKKTIRADERTMDTKEAQQKATVNYEELQLENYRVLARKGMGTESKKDARVGLELDFYEPKRGDKRSGKIIKMTRDGYEVQDEKDKKKYKFKFFDPKNYKKLMQQEVEIVEAKETGGFYVKYATAKKGPISQVYFSSKDQAEGFLQRINKMGARGIISDKPTKGAIPMGHHSVRRQQEVEVVEENTDMEEGAWDSIDWSAIADLAKSNPKKFKKKSDWIDWLNTTVAPDNPNAAKKAVRAWESMELPEILDFIEEQCKCQ